MIDKRDGYVSIRISGNNVKRIFINEAGCHQFHRVPPTENFGRTHTSVIKVSVMEIKQLNKITINEKDVEIKTTRGSGNGGQARNKLETCVVLKHIPTGITVRCESERSQYKNKMLAFEILESKLKHKNTIEHRDSINQLRREQMGTGNRAEKIKTYMFKHNLVVDHRTGEKFNLKDWMKGKWQV